MNGYVLNSFSSSSSWICLKTLARQQQKQQQQQKLHLIKQTYRRLTTTTRKMSTTTTKTTTTNGLLLLYNELLKSHKLKSDERQQETVEELQKLVNRLEGYQPPSQRQLMFQMAIREEVCCIYFF